MAASLGLEGLARHCGPGQQRAGRLRQRLQLALQGGPDRGRHAQVGQLVAAGQAVGPGQAALASRSDQLLQVERVAAALLVETLVGGAPDQLPGVVGGQRTELHALGRPVPGRLFEGGDEPGRRPHRSHGEGQQYRARRPVGDQVAEQLDRRGVGPVDVVEDEDDGAADAQSLQQGPHRPVGPVALLLQAAPVALDPVGEGREDPAQLGRRRAAGVGRQGGQLVVVE